jgi:sulfur carrier protein
MTKCEGFVFKINIRIYYQVFLKMETLKINGKNREFAEGKLPATLAGLLALLEVNQAAVVAELDGQIIKRKDFESTGLKAGQSIEIIRFVGGG